MSQDANTFDYSLLNNVKFYLNSEFYPYLNLNFDKNIYAVLFDMYARFRKSYYGYDSFKTLLNMGSFLQYGTFVIIDLRQNESIRNKSQCTNNATKRKLLTPIL